MGRNFCKKPLYIPLPGSVIPWFTGHLLASNSVLCDVVLSCVPAQFSLMLFNHLIAWVGKQGGFWPPFVTIILKWKNSFAVLRMKPKNIRDIPKAGAWTDNASLCRLVLIPERSKEICFCYSLQKVDRQRHESSSSREEGCWLSCQIPDLSTKHRYVSTFYRYLFSAIGSDRFQSI